MSSKLQAGELPGNKFINSINIPSVFIARYLPIGKYVKAAFIGTACFLQLKGGRFKQTEIWLGELKAMVGRSTYHFSAGVAQAGLQVFRLYRTGIPTFFSMCKPMAWLTRKRRAELKRKRKPSVFPLMGSSSPAVQEAPAPRDAQWPC